MKVIKPLQLSLVTRPFEYGGRAYLGFSIIAGVPLHGDLKVMQETELWQRVLPELGENGMLDAGIPKKHGEFLVTGSAHAPDGNPVESMRTRIEIGDRVKELRVFGDRYFDGDHVTRPEPFDSMPIDWQRAFGGEGFKKNPLGKGMCKIETGPHAGRWPLPNIEDPERPYGLKGQRPDPSGFGPLDISWPQRMKMAGTHDEAWLKTRFPGFPDDIRWEYFNTALPDQWRKGFWAGGERYRIEGMHSDFPALEGEVPNLLTRCFFRLKQDQALHEAKTALSTLWFLPGIELLVLIYQGSIGVGEYDAHDVETLVLGAEFPEQSRTASHYEEVMARRINPGEDTMDMLDMIRDEPLMPTGLVRSPAQNVLDRLDAEGQSPLVRNIESALDEALEEAREKTTELGHEFPEHMVPERDLSMKLPKPEEIDAFLNDKYQLMYDTTLDAYARRDEARARVSEELDKRPELGKSMDDLVADDQGPGAPKFNAEEMRSQLQGHCDRIRENGSDPADLEAMLNDPARFQQWREAEEGLQDLYRMAAHHQEPVKPLENSTTRVEELIAMLARGQSVANLDFCGVDLSGLDLSGRDLSGIFLESAILANTNLSGANLKDSVLAHAHLRETTLDNANLDEANLGKASLIQVRARGASLRETVLEGARIGDTDFSGATISGMQVFFQARIRRCNFSGVKCADLVFNEMDLNGCIFSESAFSGSVFIKSDLTKTVWQRASFEKVTFVTCTGRNADFREASLEQTTLVSNCDFSRGNFRSANLARANLRGTNLLNCDFSHSRLDQADFSEVNAGGSSFRLSNGIESRWVRADLRECDLAGANRSGSVFHLADLRGASLELANLYTADLARVRADSDTSTDGALTTRMNVLPRMADREQSHDG